MQRRITIDYFKIALSVLVITIHTQPLFSESSLIGWFISNGLARIAVPCFFLLSGYFICDKLDDRKQTILYLGHIAVVYAVWSIIYLPTYIHTIEYRSLITFALLGYYHLWFLPALMLAIMLLYAVRRFVDNDRAILAIALAVFVLTYAIESYGGNYRLVCNGLMFGFPFLTLGYLIRTKNISNRVSATQKLYPLLLGSVLLLILESYWSYGTEQYRNIYLSLFILCPTLILVVLRKSKLKLHNNPIISHLSTAIYLVHILVINIMVPLSDGYNISKLPAIIAISILISIFITIINKRIKNNIL